MKTPTPPPSFGDGGGVDGSTGTDCEREITMGGLTISPAATCFVNEHVSNQKTTLKFACNGGAATASFGTHVFTGSVTGNQISLTDAEPFVFNSCDWKSTEKITGDLDSGTVTYSYTEKPVVSCTDTPCTAGGTVTVKAGDVVVVR